MTSLNKLEISLKKELIDQIRENDIIIQGYVEEDNPKTLEELKRLSTRELNDWLDIQEARLKFLIEDETNPEEGHLN